MFYGRGKAGAKRQYLIATNTSAGFVPFAHDFLRDVERVYILKGGPGSGKSTMIKKIAKTALEVGYDVEHYHCAFDPDNVDMIIIPELSFALLDGTAPHVVVS